MRGGEAEQRESECRIVETIWVFQFRVGVVIGNNILCFQLLLQIMFIGHHPPGGSSSIILPTRDFQALVANYSDLIVMQVAGHTHFDHYKVVWRTM